jgi:hydroxypyruvate isomerase
MPRFAANLSMLFTELPLLDRFAAAAEVGFQAVELQFPYAHPAVDIARQLQALGLRLVLHNLPVAGWAGGERGLACHPGREVEFRAGVAQAMAYAQALDVGQLNCLAGLAPPDADPGLLRRTLVANLRFAARALAGAGLRLLVEPINTFDVPGFYLCCSAQAIELLDDVGEPNVFLQLDLYHAWRMQDEVGELRHTLERLLPRIAHVQLADHPGRHEPGTGEIPYADLLGTLDRLGYTGWVGCEYHPIAGTVAGLGWLEALA